MAAPKRIDNVLSELMARRGLGRVRSTEIYEQAWGEVAGPLACRHTKLGAVRGGTLEVIVAHSTLLQDLSFQKAGLLAALNERLSNQGIREIRFRLGAVA